MDFYLRAAIFFLFAIYKILSDVIPISSTDIYAINETVNYLSAINICKSMNMNLVKIGDDESNEIIFSYAMNSNMDIYWIDVNDIDKEGEWKYYDKGTITYNQWFIGKPKFDVKKNCAAGGKEPFGFWTNVACELNLGVICLMQNYSADIKNIERSSIVILPDLAPYDTAVEICKAYGLNLIRIDNDESQFVVNSVVASVLDYPFWIDLNDEEVRNQFVHSDGTRIQFENFAPGNDMRSHNDRCGSGSETLNLFWTISNCDFEKQVVCYKETTNKGNNTTTVRSAKTATTTVTNSGKTESTTSTTETSTIKTTTETTAKSSTTETTAKSSTTETTTKSSTTGKQTTTT